MSPDESHLSRRWTIIIPVKETSTAKTRLSHLDQPERAALALAFALDAAGAARECAWVERVVAVTNDADAALVLSDLGVDIVPDAPDAGQNPALHHAGEVVRAEHPLARIAAMSADLPALRSRDLLHVFDRAEGLPYWFVSDAERAGTTLLGAGPHTPLAPAFGVGSRERHRRQGAVEIDGPDLERLRRDVDTPAQLADAILLGVGLHTQAALARLHTTCTS